MLPRGRVLGVNECVSQGLSSQKRHPAELDNVHQLIYEIVRPAMPVGLCLAAASRRGRASTRQAEGARARHPTYTVGCALRGGEGIRVRLFS